MKIKAQNTIGSIEELDSVLDLSTDDALSIALDNSVNQELEPVWYDELSSKLGDTQQAAFTSGLVDRGIRVMSKKQANSTLTKLKNHFISLANKQGCVYEDDYHEACHDITESKTIGDINTWLISAGLPLKKNKPKFETEYKKKVKDVAKHPNIKKLMNKTAKEEKTERPEVKKSFPEKMPESDLVQKKTDYPPLYCLNKIIKELKNKEFKTEFLPPWKKKEAQAGNWATGEAERWLLNDQGLYNEAIDIGNTIGNNYPDIAQALEELLSGTGIMEESDLADVDWNTLAASVLNWEEVTGLEEEAAVGQEINLYGPKETVASKKAQQQPPFEETDIDEFFESGLEFEQAPKPEYAGDLDKFQRFQELQAKQSQGMLTPDEELELSALMEELGPMMPGLAKKVSQMSSGQGLEAEKTKLESQINAQFESSTESQQWLQAVYDAQDWPTLARIWRQLFGGYIDQPQKMEQRWPDADPEEYGMIQLQNSATKDPVEENIQKSARTEFKSATAKKRVTFDNCSFTAHVAKTELQRAAGLEAFDDLEPNEGMLFPFDNPSHVTFHMGSVQFPIDIIFLMEEPTALKIAKVIHNAQPGAVEHWSCPNTSYVLEVIGGTAKKKSLGIGSECVVKDRILPKG